MASVCDATGSGVLSGEEHPSTGKHNAATAAARAKKALSIATINADLPRFGQLLQERTRKAMAKQAIFRDGSSGQREVARVMREE